MTWLVTHPIFMWALLVGCMASLIGGMVGPFVVVRRIAFIAGSIAHSVLAGIGLFVWLEKVHHVAMPPPIFGALLAAICSALLIAKLQKSFHEREDSLIAAVWAAGMAIGIILLSQTPGYTSEISNLLIGNILWANVQDFYILSALACVVALFVFLKFQELKLLLFDPQEAFLQGVAVQRLYEGLLVMVAVSVVALIQIVGIVLVMTMLTLPPLLGGIVCKRLFSLIISSVVLSLFCTIFGMGVAYAFDWPAGASITLCAVSLYGIGKSGIRTHGTREGTRP